MESETERRKEAFKVLEKYFHKRYQQGSDVFEWFRDVNPLENAAHTASSVSKGFSKAQNFLLGTNSENIPGLSSARSLFSPLTRSSFSFRSELKRQHSINELTTLDDPLKQVGDETREKQYLIQKESLTAYLWRVSKFLYDRGLKHILIMLVVIAYTLLGAFVFYYLEADVDHSTRAIMAKKIEQRRKTALDAIGDLFIHEKCSIKENNGLSDVCIEGLVGILEHLATHVQLDSGGGTSKSQWQWDYWNSVFYSLSIITTIGYGNMSCRTLKGRIATILYGLFGIPLMLFLLNSIGRMMFSSVEVLWRRAKKKLKRKTKHVRKHIMVGIKSTGFYSKTDDPNQFRQNTEATIADETVGDDYDIFESFPVYLAVVIVLVYVFLCSITMCLWEEWDWFTGFYFFFISISTIGLGDEIPDHPRYAICFFVFFIIGLSLGSMCVTIMQTRVENKYMQALQLIDEQSQLAHGDPQIVVETPNQSLSPNCQNTENPILKASSRWRHPSTLTINNEKIVGNLKAQGNSISECLSSLDYYASPIFNALIKRRRGSCNQNLVRSASRSFAASENISTDTETSIQLPAKRKSMDLLGVNQTEMGGDPRRLRPKHLWKEDRRSSPNTSPAGPSHIPLIVVAESKDGVPF